MNALLVFSSHAYQRRSIDDIIIDSHLFLDSHSSQPNHTPLGQGGEGGQQQSQVILDWCLARAGEAHPSNTWSLIDPVTTAGFHSVWDLKENAKRMGITHEMRHTPHVVFRSFNIFRHLSTLNFPSYLPFFFPFSFFISLLSFPFSPSFTYPLYLIFI